MRNTKSIYRSLAFLVLLWIGLGNVHAKILLPQILSSNMVLQRDKPLKIWGFGQAGEKVSVSFAKQTKKTTTDKSGHWQVILAPLKTSAKPQSMLIKGSNTITLSNILVGEVWLCSGQSNMEYAMRKLAKIPKPKNESLGFPSDEVQQAHNNDIRIFLVNRKQLSKPDSIHKSWSIAQDSALRAFSAVGYFFAKELQQKLGIPVGIISSAVPGSAIEPWIAKEALATEPFFNSMKIGNDWGKFYTPMIEPLINFSVRGFLWYQGETNCFLNENISYAYKMKVLINSWRKAWGENNLPFYYVQIAPFNYSKSKGQLVLNGDTEPAFWEAQTLLLKLAHTGMVATTDLNDNGEDLHPTYKWEVGRRLALWALAKNYNQNITYAGPIYKSVHFKEDKAEITFENGESGLKSKDGNPLTGFSIAGGDGQFVPAEAVISGHNVQVWAKGIVNPTAVRFNWTENPSSNFYNQADLPALPFRTDNPLINQFKISNE